MTSPSQIIDDLMSQLQYINILQRRIEALKTHEGSQLSLGAEIGYLERMFSDYANDASQLKNEIVEYFDFQSEKAKNELPF